MTTSSPWRDARIARWCAGARTDPSGSVAPRPSGRSRRSSSRRRCRTASFHRSRERVGPGSVHRVVDRLDPRSEMLHAPRPRRLRVCDDLLAGRAVEPRVVEDAVMAGMRAGDDRRVVREGDRRERRHRAVTERDAHLDEAGRRWALRPARTCRRARWSWCRRTGRRQRGSGAPTGRARRRALHRLGPRRICRRRAARSRGARRSWARCRRGGRRGGSGRATSRPCRRSPSAPGPARSRSIRARRGGRPGLPSCGRRSG